MRSEKTQEKTKNNIITLKNGSAFTLPSSWNAEFLDDHLRVTAPENDFTIYFMELSGKVDTAEQLNSAWQLINPEFNLKPSQETSPPANDDWEKIFQVTYETPASEMCFVIALSRIFQDQSYVCLVEAKMSGLSRRGAELAIMLESWKPVDFKQTIMNDEQTREWSQQDIKDFETFFSDTMEKFQIPGAAIAIIKQDGKIIYINAFGVKQLRGNDPVTIDTPFMIGSTTKSLTTLMMAKLIDQKKLSWETPVAELIKNFKLADDNLTRKMRIRDTVSASTGMPRRDLDWIFKYKGIKPEERISQMKDMKPTTGFGETFQYSNPLVMLGGYAAAHAFAPELDLENAYLMAMQNLVFDPLEMKRTVIKANDALKLGAALPHGIDFDGQTVAFPLDYEEACYSVAPAGAIWSTVLDLSNYLLLEMNNGFLNGKQIVGSPSLLERRKPGIKMSENSFYGLGLSMAQEQGFNVIGHDGATLGFASHLFFLPDKGIGMTILVNSNFAHPFFACIKQKFFELSFSVQPRVEKFVPYWLREKQEFVRQKLQSTTFDPTVMNSIDNLLGEYTSPILGNARFLKNDDEYVMDFEGWKTQVGIETEKTGKKLLVLTSPPWPGLFKLSPEENDRNLMLAFGQEEHLFRRKQ